MHGVNIPSYNLLPLDNKIAPKIKKGTMDLPKENHGMFFE